MFMPTKRRSRGQMDGCVLLLWCVHVLQKFIICFFFNVTSAQVQDSFSFASLFSFLVDCKTANFRIFVSVIAIFPAWETLHFLTLYRRIFQLLEGSSLAFALKEQYLNNYKRYHHVRHTVGKVFSLHIQRRNVLRKTFSNA